MSCYYCAAGYKTHEGGFFTSLSHPGTMTRTQAVMRGKTIFLSTDGHILCDCPGEIPGAFLSCNVTHSLID